MKSQFANLLQGRTPDGARELLTTSNDPHTVVGWKLTFDAPKNLSVLWALTPAEARHRIERVYSSVVDATVTEFSSWLGGFEIRTSGAKRPHALFAAFMSGADMHQNPHLSSSVYLINAGLHTNGSAERFCRAAVAREGRLSEVYEERLYGSFSSRLGSIVPAPGEREARFSVSKALRDRFSLAPAPIPSETATQPPQRSLRNDELFAQWQLQADRAGMGRREADSVLATAQASRRLAYGFSRLQHRVKRLARRTRHRIQAGQALSQGCVSLSQADQGRQTDSQDLARKLAETHRQTISH